MTDKKEKKSTADWPALFHETKERIVKALWALPGVPDGERELALKNLLWELEQLQTRLEAAVLRREDAESILKEENDLLRSLLGTHDSDLRARILALGQEAHDLQKDLITARDEAAALREKTAAAAERSAELEERLKAARLEAENLRAQQTAGWQGKLAGFADEQSALQAQLADLGREVGRVHELLDARSEELTREKQAELAALQARLLGEMEKALAQREDLLWAEEDLFARGVAQKLRGELQAATGRLQLTLERFRLMAGEDPGRAWERRWRLFRAGPEELSRAFREVGDELRRAVETLEDYLKLTHRRPPARQDVLLPDLLRGEAAKRYADRLEKGALEILVPEVLPAVPGDPELLGHAVAALLDNAFESLPKSGGRVRMEAMKSPDGRAVWVQIADAGEGIPAGQRDRLFQPFFTTKSGHRGLGLARARRYAEWHRGTVELVESRPGSTIFRLTVPL